VEYVAGPKDFLIRPPAVAGRFYPGDPQGLSQRRFGVAAAGGGGGVSALVSGGRDGAELCLMPGWICSGAIAGQTIAELARLNRDSPPRVVVVFGAIHTPLAIEQAALDSRRVWRVPGGDSRTAEDLAERLGAGASSLFVRDERFHQQEHAIEVELPLIRQRGRMRNCCRSRCR